MSAETKLELLRRRMAGMSVNVDDLRRKELEYMSLIRIQVTFHPPPLGTPLAASGSRHCNQRPLCPVRHPHEGLKLAWLQGHV